MTVPRCTARTCGAIVLVGGRSSRLGRDKARVQLGGLTLVERVVGACTGLVSRVLLIGGRSEDFIALPWTWVADCPAICGPLGGVAAGLEAIQRPWCFVLACDLPFVQPRLLAALTLAAVPGVEAVVPRTARGLEPLLALYETRAARRALHQVAQEGGRKVDLLAARLHTSFLDEPVLRGVDASLRSLFNLNTESDLEAARGLAD